MEFLLAPGDLYIMSSKAIGNDWKRAARVTTVEDVPSSTALRRNTRRSSKGKKRYALRHAAKF